MSGIDANVIAHQILGIGVDPTTRVVGNVIHMNAVAQGVTTVNTAIESIAQTGKAIMDEYRASTVPADDPFRKASEKALIGTMENLSLVQTNIANTPAPRMGMLG